DRDAQGALYLGRKPTGCFKSLDGGTTWTRINEGLAGLTYDAVVASAARPGHLLASTRVSSLGHAELFRSTDGGSTWA
uniref:WD40/YVTN/BNR-like repeat-containing protein n=1 Tax=Salmonella enterica TaxID=28901 RepID=UPI0032992423